MEARSNSPIRFVVGAALLIAPLAIAAQELDKDLPQRPAVSPNVIATDPTTEQSERSEAPCPCFDVQELIVLSAHSWDLCQHEGLLLQVTRWIGDEVPPSGRIGYHALASLPNPRSGSGTCQYFLRDSSDHEVRTLLRRWPSLDDLQAETCFEMMASWIEGLGDCGPQADQPEAAASDASARPDSR